jgi:transposase-like protein
MTVIAEPTTTSTKDVYTNPEARKILSFLIWNAGTTLSPTILPTDEIAYPQVESILGEKTSAAGSHIQLLKTMTEANVLAAEFIDKVPSCPMCGSKQVSTRYICPQCFTFDITQTFLFEHLKCGKVGSSDEFAKDQKIICPKCQTVLHDFGVEYRSVGAWYKCNRCNHSFNSPPHSHFCRPKHHEFTSDAVQLVPLFQYRINPETAEQIKLKVLVYAEAITQLESLGLTVLAPHSLLGKSGLTQPFDIVVKQGKKGWRGEEKTIVIDIIIGKEPVEIEAVKKFNGKVKDVKHTESWLITVPGLDSEAAKLIGNLNLSHAAGPTLLEAMQVFQSKSDLKSYVER